MNHFPTEMRAFATTRWSVVLAAGRGGSDALAVLCERYWHPLYAFTRRLGYSPHDAEDLTQGFLAQLLARGGLGKAVPEMGRFRTFLLGALKNFISDQRDRARALKRGGGKAVVPMEWAEERFLAQDTRGQTPAETGFDRGWAIAVVERALERVRAQYASQPEVFEALRPMLTGGARDHAETGAALGLNEGAVKVALHRLRRRYGEALRAEVGETVGDPGDVEGELRYLLTVLEE